MLTPWMDSYFLGKFLATATMEHWGTDDVPGDNQSDSR